MSMMRQILALFAVFLLTTGIQGQLTNCGLAKRAFGVATGPTVNRSMVKSPYCTSLNSTCCTADDFNTLYKMWEDPLNNNTLRIIRTKEMTQLVQTVRYLNQAQKAVSDLAAQIKLAKYIGDPACVTPAHLQKNIEELDLVKSALSLFEVTSARCWEFTKNQMNAMMCASCDPLLYGFYEPGKKTIQITDTECNSFIDSCGEHIQAINSIIFYFNIYYRLSFCNDKGGFSEPKVPESVFLPDNTIKAITNCMNIRNKDDCAQVCMSEYGYTTMINFEYRNLKKIVAFVNKIKDSYANRQAAAAGTVTKTAILKNASAMRRRRRARLMQATNSSSLNTTALNELSVIVMKQGVEFSKYTFNNSDGYSDMDLAPVFKSAQLWTFGLLSLTTLLALM